MKPSLSQAEVELRFTKANLKLISKYVKQKIKVDIQCYCGNVFKSTSADVFSGHTKSCGCRNIQAVKDRFTKNLTNQKFHKLLVLEQTDKRNRGKIVWKCQCECGNICEVHSGALLTNNTKSCGCLLSDSKKANKNPNWNPNLTDEYRTNYKKYTRSASVRKTVFNRDNYTCQCCKKRGTYLNAHHLDSYYGFPDKREDVDNLVTLCVKCHKGFHKQYGRGINTKDEFIEYQRSF